MNCNLVQRRLLSIEDPAEAPADVRAHLASCQPCRDWQGQLVQLEQHVPLLPVPRSRGKRRFLARLLRRTPKRHIPETETVSSEATGQTIAAEHPLPQGQAYQLTRQRLLAGVAAAALIAVGFWILVSGKKPPAPAPVKKPAADPLLSGLVQLDSQLARAGTPRERVEYLSDMANILFDETRALAQEAAGEELAAIAGLYEQVVREGIIKQARAVQTADRRKILNPIAERLRRAARTADGLRGKVPPQYSKPLASMAQSAWEGYRGLTELVPEERS
jgi:hypothetical protein